MGDVGNFVNLLDRMVRGTSLNTQITIDYFFGTDFTDYTVFLDPGETTAITVSLGRQDLQD